MYNRLSIDRSEVFVIVANESLHPFIHMNKFLIADRIIAETRMDVERPRVLSVNRTKYCIEPVFYHTIPSIDK